MGQPKKGSGHDAIPQRAKLLRDKGQGTVSRQGEKWRARAPLSQRRKQLGLFETKEQAEASLGDGRVPFGQWMLAYVAYRERVLRVRNAYDEKNIIGTHVTPDTLSALRVVDVVTSDVRGWLQRMLSKRVGTPRNYHVPRPDAPLSFRTVNNALSLVRCGLQHAVDMGAVDRNVARDIRVPRTARATEREPFEGVLEPKEQRALLEGLPLDSEIGRMVRVAMGLGLRRGELLSLRRCDVHLGREPFVVVRSGHKGPTKGGKPRRLPLFGFAFEALSQDDEPQRPEQQKQLDAASDGVQLTIPQCGLCEDQRPDNRDDDDGELAPPSSRLLVFPGAHGGKLARVPIDDFRAALARAGIKRRVRWHDLRHTCATSLLVGWWGRRWTVPEVQRFMGHSAPTTTEKYLHHRNEIVFEAARGMKRDVNEIWTAGRDRPSNDGDADGEGAKRGSGKWPLRDLNPRQR